MTVDRRAPTPPARSVLALVAATSLLAAVLASAGTAAILLATAPAGGEPAPSADATGAAPTAAPSAAVLTRLDESTAIAAVASTIEPSVVTISAASGGPFGSVGGSGIVVGTDGLILTTDLVAPDNVQYAILFSDEHATTASVVARDDAAGIVLLRAATANLVPASLSGGGELAVGQLVIAVGSPLGSFTDTVTAGIVSGMDRSIDLRDPSTGTRVRLDGLIQTDAAINAGSSGGPLLDAAGTVVGVIATSAGDGQGIGFAIPIADALPLIARAGAGA